ncbi:MAG: glycine--tRNA ligase subunit beta, partial [Terriglobales bacterium]
RLAVLARGIRASQPDLEEQVLGPSTKVAFKAGKPTPAAEFFAKKVGLDPSKLEKVTTPKGEYLAAHVTRKGRAAGEVLAEKLPAEVLRIYWPKTMYWRGKAAERFVRPARWLVAMLDGALIPLELAGIRAGSASRGHRTLSSGPVNIASPSDYAVALETAGVVASRTAREQQIRKALDAATRALPGARWREDAALLATVVNLTEFPSAILGNFDREFLTLPEEVLVTVMRDHQKYFAVESADGKLAPHFLAVLNTDSDPDGAIRHGHERVLRARFADARFFWEADQKRPLRERIELLKAVTFQKDLGSYYEKTERVARLANTVAADLVNAGFTIDRDAVNEAAWLAKTDLTTELVKEFTELQGVVGGLYARAQGFSAAIADAIYDHYKPESMDEPAPRTAEAAVLSIADKADSIAGMFGLGLQPTGSKDPFALRRQANGIIKTLAEHKIPLSLSKLFVSAIREHTARERRELADEKASKLFEGTLRDILRPLASSGLYLASQYLEGAPADAKDYESVLGAHLGLFLKERLDFYLRESRGLEYDVVRAVLAASSDEVPDAHERAKAVGDVVTTPEFRSIAIAFKRINNILRQAREMGFVPPPKLDVNRFTAVEQELFSKMQPTGQNFQAAREARRYNEALRELSNLAPYIDAFFDKVMVMVDDADIRGNRLRFLSEIIRSFAGIAHFSEIVTEGKGN